MKIRIKGDTVRFRLTKTEVESLCARGELHERTRFPSGEFRYGLRVEGDRSQFGATFDGATITVLLPEETVRGWADDARVGFETELALESGGSLGLLIEKDFVCLDNTREDQSDNYPHPSL